MSNVRTLARPYAKAAFDLAREQGEYPAWGEFLDAAAGIVSQSAVAALLANPMVGSENSANLVCEAFSEEPAGQFRRFLELMAHNDRLSLLPEIARLYARMREEAEGQLKVRVVSAIALENDQAKRMSEALAKRFEREIRLENEVDPSVLGGAIVYAGDEVIDGSLRGRLERLRQTLN